MRRPLLAQVNGQVDIIEHAILPLQLPQGAALYEVRGNSLEPAPSIKTAVRGDGKCREVTHLPSPRGGPGPLVRTTLGLASEPPALRWSGRSP